MGGGLGNYASNQNFLQENFTEGTFLNTNIKLYNELLRITTTFGRTYTAVGGDTWVPTFSFTFHSSNNPNILAKYMRGGNACNLTRLPKTTYIHVRYIETAGPDPPRSFITWRTGWCPESNGDIAEHGEERGVNAYSENRYAQYGSAWNNLGVDMLRNIQYDDIGSWEFVYRASGAKNVARVYIYDHLVTVASKTI